MGLGMQSLLEDLGHRAKVNILTDATTSKSLAYQRGLGKVQHIEVSELLGPGGGQEGEGGIGQINGSFSLADLFAKHVDKSTLERMVEGLGGMHSSGRHELAPQLCTLHDGAPSKGASTKDKDGPKEQKRRKKK